MRLRCAQVALAVIAAMMLGPTGAQADSETWRDPGPKDSAGRLEIKALRHGHTANGTLKHTIVTYKDWSKRRFDGSIIMFVYFSYYGDSCADARVWIDVKRGELRARWQDYSALGCPEGNDSGSQSDFYGKVKARKPARDRVVLIVPPDLFEGADAYKWSVTTLWGCDGEPCGDDAPDRANSDRTKIRHEL